METGHGCDFDSVEIYDGGKQRRHNRIAKLCGRQLPQQFRSAGPKLLIRFHSDFSVGKKGFKLQYQISGVYLATEKEKSCFAHLGWFCLRDSIEA